MPLRSTLHLPPSETTKYVRIEHDGKTVAYLNPTSLDVVLRDETDFEQRMRAEGAVEEAHSAPGRWVVRLRGDEAVAALHELLSQRV